MEDMTDFQYKDAKRNLILLILEIVRNFPKAEAIKKIEALLPEE